jgi:hypothetical protein
MAEAPDQKTFAAAGAAPLGLAGAVNRAREELALLTQLQVDAVTRSARRPDGGWTITLDLIESVARMGDNDLLCTYEVSLDPQGGVTDLARIARYRREDGARASRYKTRSMAKASPTCLSGSSTKAWSSRAMFPFRWSGSSC